MQHRTAAPGHVSSTSLYRRLTGDRWTELDSPVRKAHLDDNRLCRVGSFRVLHGAGKLAKLILFILRTPRAAESVPTTLTVTRSSGGEKWVRVFGDRTLITTQAEGPDGLLAERMGFAEIRFSLQVIDGALVYQQTGAAVRLGRLSVTLPRWLRPQVNAREEADGPNGTHLSVEVTLPVVGRLISYEGGLHGEEAE
ncbi:MAG TPA: DUF4166 domain-containing protein [Blastocatellia bacterium]|nr:DUF4166 domain-containing protein [Blastocatellia bacterium]